MLEFLADFHVFLAGHISVIGSLCYPNILHNYLNSWTWSTIPGCQWKIWLLTRKSILSKTTAAPSFQSYVWNSDEKPGNKIELVTVLENVFELSGLWGWILSSLLKLIYFTSIKKANDIKNKHIGLKSKTRTRRLL